MLVLLLRFYRSSLDFQRQLNCQQFSNLYRHDVENLEEKKWLCFIIQTGCAPFNFALNGQLLLNSGGSYTNTKIERAFI